MVRLLLGLPRRTLGGFSSAFFFDAIASGSAKT